MDVASGADRHLDIGLQSSPLFSLLFREAFRHPYISFFHLLVNVFSVTIREYGSTLYVGLARAVPPTNTNFQTLLLLTQVGMPYTNTHKNRTAYFKSTLTFMGPAKRWKCLSAAQQKREILAILLELDVYHHFTGLCFIAEVNFWRNRRFLRFIHQRVR